MTEMKDQIIVSAADCSDPHSRYEQSAEVVALFKSSGALAARELFRLLSDEKFQEYPVGTKLKIIELATEKAFGKSDSFAGYKNMLAREFGSQDKQRSSYAKELSHIATFPEKRNARSAAQSAAASGDVVDGVVNPDCSSQTTAGDEGVAPEAPAPFDEARFENVFALAERKMQNDVYGKPRMIDLKKVN